MDHGRARARVREPHGRGRPGKLIAAARHWASAKPRKPEDDGKGSAKAFGVKVDGWKIREPGDTEDLSYPHPERLELAQRITELRKAEGSPEDLKRLQDRYDRLVGLFPVWAENELSVKAFIKIRTQWRTGAAGAVGLDYPAVERRIERMQLATDVHERVLEDIELMEGTILATWAEESERRSRELENKRSR